MILSRNDVDNLNENIIEKLERQDIINMIDSLKMGQKNIDLLRYEKSIHEDKIEISDEIISRQKKSIKQFLILLEELTEEVENCYGRDTDLTEKCREFINKDWSWCND